jgi:hypothetical protein
VNAVDEIIRILAQNPTIVLQICINKDDTEVRYALRNKNYLIGVATYDNVQIKKILEQLSTIDELTKRIRLLEDVLLKRDTKI